MGWGQRGRPQRQYQVRREEDQGHRPRKGQPLRGGQIKDTARRLGRSGQDTGSRCQERLGIAETKERDNFTTELASNVTCHRQAGTTSSLSQGPVDLACGFGDSGDYR